MRSVTRTCGVGLVLLMGCSRPARLAQDPKALEAEVRARGRAVTEAEERKDLEAVMPFWAEDAVAHVDGATPIQGRLAVRQAYEQQWFPSMISFRGEPTSLTVSASGDLAYETGTNHLQVKGPQGPTAATSKYLLVWRRDADGQWRVAAISVTSSPTRP